jgi:membrane protease YdiL (CAAX protease family)
MCWAVLVSVGEETLFRAVIYGALRQHLGVTAALPAGSLVFALAHGLGNRVVYLFSAGCVLTYLYEWKGSVYIPILAHLISQTTLALYLIALT